MTILTTEEIVGMADKCGLLALRHLEAFAKLVAAKAAERELTDEQADKVIEQVEDMVGSTTYAWDLVPPRSLVRAILKSVHDVQVKHD